MGMSRNQYDLNMARKLIHDVANRMEVSSGKYRALLEAYTLVTTVQTQLEREEG